MTIWRIEPARAEHIPPIAANMREAERHEVWASNRRTPEEALQQSLAASDRAWTCFVHGVPAFMWGVSQPGDIPPGNGNPWLLGTDAVYEVGREFLKQSRAYVDKLQEGFARLENRVHAGNELSILWLKWCGFTLDNEPETINGEQFYRFWRESEPMRAAVRKISVAEVFANPAFSSLCREYAEESAIAGLPDPKEKLAAYQALEAGGSDTFSVYGAFLGDTLIGFVALLAPVLPHYGTTIAVAESLFVGKAHRKTGAGMLLIRRAEKRAREMGSPGILFSAPTGGRLAVLLPRIGYRETNRVFMKGFTHD